MCLCVCACVYVCMCVLVYVRAYVRVYMFCLCIFLSKMCVVCWSKQTYPIIFKEAFDIFKASDLRFPLLFLIFLLLCFAVVLNGLF